MPALLRGALSSDSPGSAASVRRRHRENRLETQRPGALRALARSGNAGLDSIGEIAQAAFPPSRRTPHHPRRRSMSTHPLVLPKRPQGHPDQDSPLHGGRFVRIRHDKIRLRGQRRVPAPDRRHLPYRPYSRLREGARQPVSAGAGLSRRSTISPADLLPRRHRCRQGRLPRSVRVGPCPPTAKDPTLQSSRVPRRTPPRSPSRAGLTGEGRRANPNPS